jgi:Flp pilus assembly protein TadD
MSDKAASWSYRFGLLGKAQCLRKMGRLDEAEQMMIGAREILHGNITPLVELAEIAQDRGDWQEAIQRWELVMTRFGLLPTGFLGCAAALEQLGRTEEAETVLRKSIDLHRDQPAVSMRYAMMAEERGDFEEAVRRWDAAREKFPNHPDPYLHGAGSLDRLGRKTEAAALREEHKRRSGH